MKKEILPNFLLLLLINSACTSNYTLQGNFVNVQEGDTIELMEYGRQSPKITHLFIDKNKEFKIKITDDSTELISLSSPKYAFPLWFVPNKGEECEATIEDWENRKIKIEKDDKASAYYTFCEELNKLVTERKGIEEYLTSLLKQDSFFTYQELLMKDTFLNVDSKIRKCVAQFLSKDSLSPYNALVIAQYRSITHEHKSFYSHVKKKALNHYKPQWLYHQLLKEQQKNIYSIVKERFIDFQLLPLNDWKHNLSFYTQRGNVLLCFCDVEDKYSCFVVEELLKLRKDFKDEEVKLLFIDPIRSLEEVKEKVDTMKWNGEFTIVIPEEKLDLFKGYGIKKLPSLYFITKDGVVKYQTLYPLQMGKYIQSFLKKDKE
ncbi:MAG TPA: hypothetical protein DDY68_01845 [Porphyromonadaceae bacterium]|nr:hypothetical protein [Porphyromonadaceae bacterium]